MQSTDDKLNVWFYWENVADQHMPEYLYLCFQLAEKILKGAKVHLITPENLDEYLSIQNEFDLSKIRLHNREKSAVALKVDVLRVELLYKFGGLWIDIDCLTLRDFSQEISTLLQKYDFVGLQKTSKETPYVSNNFMASIKQGNIIESYRERIHKKLKEKLQDNLPFSWSELGSDLLTETISDNFSKEIVTFIDEKRIHPFDYTEADMLEQEDPLFSVFESIPQDAYCIMLYNSIFSEDIKRASKAQILSMPNAIGQTFRRLLDSEVYSSQQGEAGTNRSRKKLKFEDIRIIFTTVDRPESCEGFLKSIRANIDQAIEISFVVQASSQQARIPYQEMSERYRADVIFVEDDFGLSAARNLAVRSTEEPVIFLCDDDFVFTDRTRLDLAMQIFEENPNIVVLGGLFENYYYEHNNELKNKDFSSFDHKIIRFKNLPNSVVFLPSVYTDCERRYVDHEIYFRYTDTVNNFALIDRSVFSDLGVFWDDNFKIMAEHEDFYLSLEQKIKNTDLKIAYTNALVVEHHRKTNPDFEQKRSRTESLKECLEKWKVTSFIFPGKRIDEIDSDGQYRRSNFRYWRLMN